MSVMGFVPPLTIVAPKVAETLERAFGVIKDGGSKEEVARALDEIALFSPFAIDDVDQELVLLGAGVVGLYLSKTDKGMGILKTISEQYFKTIASIVSSVAKGGSSHVISSLTAQMTIVRMMRRLGLISQQEANVIHHELVWAINKVTFGNILEAIGHVTSMVFGEAAKLV